jgi:hypothetical protein
MGDVEKRQAATTFVKFSDTSRMSANLTVRIVNALIAFWSHALARSSSSRC